MQVKQEGNKLFVTVAPEEALNLMLLNNSFTQGRMRYMILQAVWDQLQLHSRKAREMPLEKSDLMVVNGNYEIVFYEKVELASVRAAAPVVNDDG